MMFYDSDKLLHIEVATSKKGIGAVMLQQDKIVKNESKSDDKIPTNLRPISYASKTLSITESNYSNIEQELLGLLFVIVHFKHVPSMLPISIFLPNTLRLMLSCMLMKILHRKG